MYSNTPDISALTTHNQSLVDGVYVDMLANLDQGMPVVEKPRFTEVPNFKKLIAKRSHDLLCIPK